MFIPIEVTSVPDSLEDGPIAPGGKRRRSIESRTVDLIHYHGSEGWNTIDREVKLTSQQDAIAGFLRSCLESENRTCEALRQAWLAQR
jgi:hypothetical protein